MSSLSSSEESTSGGGSSGSVNVDEKEKSMSEMVADEEASVVSCRKSFDDLWWCYTPGHQGGEYYRRGRFDSCREPWKLLTKCLAARNDRTGEAQKAWHAAAAARRAAVERRPDAVWEYRDPPGVGVADLWPASEGKEN